MQNFSGIAKLNALTGLRFVAAGAIVLHHIKDHGFPSDFAGAWLLNNGVSFFFVLSGFILFYVYPSFGSGEATRRFLMARFARIWPAHIAALTLAYVLLKGEPSSFSTGEDTPALWLANVLLVQAWVPFHQFFFGYNGVSWSISVEMFFYLSFPFLVRNFAQTWWWKLGAALAFAIALIALSAWAKLPAFSGLDSGLTLNGLVSFNPLARLFEFVLGMCAALAWRNVRSDVRLGPVAGTLAELSVIGLLVLIGVAAWPFGQWLDAVLGPAAAQWFNQGGTLSLGFALLIFVMALERGAISAVLASRGAVFLGEISFMIYMTHQVVLRGGLAHADWFAGWSGAAKLALYVGVVLALSAAMWRWIEVPTRQALLRWFDGHQGDMKLRPVTNGVY